MILIPSAGVINQFASDMLHSPTHDAIASSSNIVYVLSLVKWCDVSVLTDTIVRYTLMVLYNCI